MKLIKQQKLLTFQVILSLIILNTQISFAQNKKINLKDWEGSYVGIGIANSSSETKVRSTTDYDHFGLKFSGNKSKEQNEITYKIGYLENLDSNLFFGLELNKYADIKKESNNNNPTDATDTTRLHLEDILSLELRLGAILDVENEFLNNSMIYGKVGAATLRSATKSYEPNKGFPSHIGSSKARHYGSVIGMGIEKKLLIFDDPKINNNTSISLEYNIMNFNKKTEGADSPGSIADTLTPESYIVNPKINNLMLTINYRFSDTTLGLKNLIK
jgi:opacity protein-like surface antigen